MPQKLKAIFFDVGNTLLFPNRTKILAPLYERKISPSPELLRALECRTKIEFDAIVERGPADHGFWFLFYSHLMDELGIEGDGLRDLLVKTLEFQRIGAIFVRARRRFCNAWANSIA